MPPNITRQQPLILTTNFLNHTCSNIEHKILLQFWLQLQAVHHCRSVVLTSLCKCGEPSPDLSQSTVMLRIEHFLANKYNCSFKGVYSGLNVVRNGKGGYDSNLDPCITVLIAQFQYKG